jgi:hypothetical protein
MMNFKHYIRLSWIMLLTLCVSSCSVVEGIFKAGMGVGIFAVVAVVALILFIVVRLSRSKKSD